MTTNDCESLRERMMEVLYDEADAPTRRRLQEHLQACEGCRDEMAGLGRVRRALQEARTDVPEVPPSRVVFLGRPAPRPWARAARWAAAAALAAAALLGIFQARIEVGGQGFTLAFGGDASRQAMLGQVRQEIDAALASVRAEGDRERAALLAAFQQDLQRREDTRRRAQNAAFHRLATDWETVRQQDLGFLLTQLGSLEERTGQEMQRTQELLRYAVLASEPVAEGR